MCNKPETPYCPRQQKKHRKWARLRAEGEIEFRKVGPRHYVAVNLKTGRVLDRGKRFTMAHHNLACCATCHWNPAATTKIPNRQ